MGFLISDIYMLTYKLIYGLIFLDESLELKDSMKIQFLICMDEQH